MKRTLSTIARVFGLLLAPVFAPSASAQPRPLQQTQATAQSRDGTTSCSQHRGGTCSHHGGVAKWLAHE